MIPKKQRDNDVYLMDKVLTTPKMSPADIRKFNYCRLYLGAVTLADITNAAGTHIDASIYDGHKIERSNMPCRNWHLVHQKNPNNTSWAVWRRILRSFTTTPKGTTLKLSQPLGNWTDIALH